MDYKGLVDNIANLGIKIVIALVVMWICFRIIERIGKSLDKIFEKNEKLDKTVCTTLNYVIRTTLKVLVILALVGYLGINTAGIATIIASLGVGVGMAINGAIANFAGGVVVLVTRPYKVGDFVEVAGTVGTVQEIRLVHTLISTLDNKVVYIPNGTASGATVVNYSEKEIRRVDQAWNISYESDFEKAKGILLDVAEKNPAILKDPAPFARVTAQGSSGIEVTTRLWCKGADYWDVFFYMNEKVKEAFDANGISIPYPQMDVHMKN